MGLQSVILKHNIEMGHRLWRLGGKCSHLHGHSWWIELEIIGEPDKTGILIDFHEIKASFRTFLDIEFDHHFVLDREDPLVELLRDVKDELGIVTLGFQPTVENMAKYWGNVARDMFGSEYEYRVRLSEASSNAATWRSYE